MTPEASSEIAWVKALRAAGVKSAKCDGDFVTEVEFFPFVPDTDKSPSLPKHLDLGAPSMCLCGHDELSHNDVGACLQGCELERCQEASK